MDVRFVWFHFFLLSTHFLIVVLKLRLLCVWSTFSTVAEQVLEVAVHV